MSDYAPCGGVADRRTGNRGETPPYPHHKRSAVLHRGLSAPLTAGRSFLRIPAVFPVGFCGKCFSFGGCPFDPIFASRAFLERSVAVSDFRCAAGRCKDHPLHLHREHHGILDFSEKVFHFGVDFVRGCGSVSGTGCKLLFVGSPNHLAAVSLFF